MDVGKTTASKTLRVETGVMKTEVRDLNGSNLKTNVIVASGLRATSTNVCTMNRRAFTIA